MTLDRRSFLAATAASASAAAVGAPALAIPKDHDADAVRAGKLKQSACRWCYSSIAIEPLCEAAAAMGLASVELLRENEYHVPAKYGITCAIAFGPGNIPDGWNDPANHDRLVAEGERLLPLIADAGLPTMIVFSGNRRGMDDQVGLEHCATGLRRLMPTAERLGIDVVMEILNSKRDHRDYQCDSTPWGVKLCEAVGSERFGLLYDIYHAQIMEGDVIATIRAHHGHIKHYHTGGVPGRREIDRSQELWYPAICRAIAETGYQGYLGQEFIPSRDPLTSLAEAARICTV